MDYMNEFGAKSIVVEKKVDKKALAMSDTLELRNQLGCVKMALFLAKYNKNLVRDFYANLTAGIKDSQSPYYDVVCVRGTVILYTRKYSRVSKLPLMC